MRQTLKLILIVAALPIMAILLSHEPTPAVVAQSDFGTRWQVSNDLPPLKRQDRLASPTVEPIRPPPVAASPNPVPPMVSPIIMKSGAKPAHEIERPTRVHHHHHQSHDICRGKGRRWYNHHRSWHCRR